MELNQIKYFLALARELNFTRAALHCQVSQPALTRAIQKLEAELHGPLFLRERGHTQLTELGRLMQPSLERALGAAEEAKLEAETFRNRSSSPLRLGVEHSIAPAIFVPVLTEIRRHVAQMDFSLTHCPHENICERLLDGELDLALLVARDGLSERMHRWQLFLESYVVICPQDHPFQQQREIPLQSFADENLLLLKDIRCPVQQLMKSRHVEPRGRIFLDNQEQIIGMVSAAFGITVAGESVETSNGLVRRPLSPDPGKREVILARVAGRPLGPTPGLFLKLMRSRSWVPSKTRSGSK